MLIEERVPDLAGPCGDHAVVAAKVAFAQPLEVEIQLVEQRGVSAAREGGRVAGVAAKELVGAEAREEDAGGGGVGGGVEEAGSTGGEVEGKGDGEVHFGVLRGHEGYDGAAVGEDFGVGDVDGNETEAAGGTCCEKFGVGRTAGEAVGADAVRVEGREFGGAVFPVRIEGVFLAGCDDAWVFEGDVEKVNWLVRGQNIVRYPCDDSAVDAAAEENRQSNILQDGWICERCRGGWYSLHPQPYRLREHRS